MVFAWPAELHTLISCPPILSSSIYVWWKLADLHQWLDITHDQHCIVVLNAGLWRYTTDQPCLEDVIGDRAAYVQDWKGIFLLLLCFRSTPVSCEVFSGVCVHTHRHIEGEGDRHIHTDTQHICSYIGNLQDITSLLTSDRKPTLACNAGTLAHTGHMARRAPTSQSTVPRTTSPSSPRRFSH